MQRPRFLALAALCAGAFLAAPAFGHGAQIGDIAIGHPYATPSLAGTSNGAAYLATLENKGAVADRLVRASSPVAARVELHTMGVDGQGVMRMREVDGIALASKEKLQMKPGTGYHLMLIGLKQPLKDEASFPMTLEFERAGRVEVTVVVHPPKAAAGSASGHMH